MNTRFSIITGTLLASVLFLAASPAVAATPSASAASLCQFQSSLNALKAAQAQAARNPAVGQKAELEARKNLLTRVLSCAVAETKEVQQALRALKYEEGGLQQLQGTLDVKFDELIGYYESKKGTVAQLTLQGTKDTAKQVNTQRSAVYAPLAQKVLNLTLWSKNQSLVNTVEFRLEQIEATIKTLKLTENERIASLLTQAAATLAEAKDANNRAQEMMKRTLGEDPQLDIKVSLDKLSKAYQSFFEISEEVSELLSAE